MEKIRSVELASDSDVICPTAQISKILCTSILNASFCKILFETHACATRRNHDSYVVRISAFLLIIPWTRYNNEKENVLIDFLEPFRARLRSFTFRQSICRHIIWFRSSVNHSGSLQWLRPCASPSITCSPKSDMALAILWRQSENFFQRLRSRRPGAKFVTRVTVAHDKRKAPHGMMRLTKESSDLAHEAWALTYVIQETHTHRGS